MSNWSRFFRAAVWAIYVTFSAGLVPAVRAVDDNGESSSGPWLSRTWQTDEGLPDNNVTGVVQTGDGYLWVATLGGLVRFNGEGFETFSTINLPKAPNKVARRMFLGRDGQLWLVMDRGVVVAVGHDAVRVFDANDGIPNSRVSAIAEDEQGGVWFDFGDAVCRILDGKVMNFGAGEGLPPGNNIRLAADKEGQLWFASGTHAGIVRAGHWQTLLTLDSPPLCLAAASSGGVWMCTATNILKCLPDGTSQVMATLPAQVTAQVMLEDSSGALWIGTGADGVLRLDGKDLAPVAVSHPDITALTEDREGNIWVGTAGGGLNQLRPRAMSLIGSRAGLPFESVRSLCQDASGWTWVALQNGSLAHGRDGDWSLMTATEGWPGGNVSCVTAATGGGVWIGTHDRGVQRWQAGKFQEWGQHEGLGNPNVRSLLQSANGNLWIATDLPSRLWLFRNGAFQELHLPDRVLAIRAMSEGPDGTIWAGTSDGQVLRIQGTTITNESSDNKWPVYSVRSLYASPDGGLWLGYAGGGLGRWQNGVYSRITTDQGLYNDYISQILADGQGGMWLTSNRGLFQVRLRELKEVAGGRSTHLHSIACGRSEGIASLQPVYENNPTAWRGNDGRLWFATRKGVLMVQPDKVRDNPVPPAVLVSRVVVDEHPVALYDSHFPLRPPEESRLEDLRTLRMTLKLVPGYNKIEFDFAALSFSSPENVQFRYRLKGFDADWIEAGTRHSAIYPRLTPGRYEFEVTACNESGVWNSTGFLLPFTAEPFFWQTWWFSTLVLVAFTATIIAIVRYISFRRLSERMRALEQQAALDKERARIAKDLHDDLGASMTQLTLVLELAVQQRPEPDAAIDTVRDGLRAARETIKSLDAAVWAVNPANNTLPELVAYIGQFGMEFLQQANIRCLLDLPDHPRERTVSAELRHSLFLIVKEALNNVVRHARANEVRLQIMITSDALHLLIADNGRGIERPSEYNTLADGLRNMRQRAEELGAQFQIDTVPGAGTKILVRYPWPLAD